MEQRAYTHVHAAKRTRRSRAVKSESHRRAITRITPWHLSLSKSRRRSNTGVVLLPLILNDVSSSTSHPSIHLRLVEYAACTSNMMSWEDILSGISLSLSSDIFFSFEWLPPTRTRLINVLHFQGEISLYYCPLWEREIAMETPLSKVFDDTVSATIDGLQEMDFFGRTGFPD